MVFRIFVEKKPEFDVQAGALLRELRHIFGIESLRALRIINRYDTQGLDGAFADEAKRTVFSEPQLDNIYETLPDDSDIVIGAEYLPGQFDQRADSCAQCLQMIAGGQRPAVRSARMYLLYGQLNDTDIQIIKNHLINPVESKEASLELPDTLDEEQPGGGSVPVLSSFLILGEADLPEFCSKHGLAMDPEDLALCHSYFKSEGRTPTLTELRVIDTYWSDHCRHTTFLTNLKVLRIKNDFARESFENYLWYKKSVGREQEPVTLMELATLGRKVLKQEDMLTALDESDEVNACSVKIRVDEDGQQHDWLLMFKNETHNHPTEIEPFGGAATCIGGAIRDPLSGRSYVYQAMRVTGSGDPAVPVSDTIAGKLPQRVITAKAAKGFSSYGNQIGVATGLVREIYHPGYVAKRMEAGAVIGAVPQRSVIRENPEPGDKVILVGGRTGRDGCGGATGSSKSHNADSLSRCGAEVQKGNAPEERKLQRLFRNPAAARMIKRCNDFGAGGVAVAVGELAGGLDIDLGAIPKKYSGLDGTELAISESQERMAVVTCADDADAFIAMAEEENLEATVIAEVTGTKRLIMRLDGRKIVDISREFLDTNGTVKHASVAVSEAEDIMPQIPSEPVKTDLKEFFALLVSDLNVCSQNGLTENFDSTIGSGSVLLPLGGKYQMTPAQAMAAKIPVPDKETTTCSLMSNAFYPYCSEKNPYAAAYLAVTASVAKVIAAGGSLSRCWLSFQEYFERLGDNPGKWGKPFSALLGAFEAQVDLGVAAIGGKDSMSGTFEKLDVPPTLISFAVSTAQTDNVISGEFKQPGSEVIMLAPEYRSDGVPYGGNMKEMLLQVEQLISEKRVLSAYVVETGGVGEALFKMAIGNRIGFIFDESFEDASILTGHYIGSIILEIKEEDENERIRARIRKTYIPLDSFNQSSLRLSLIRLGKTTSEFSIAMGDNAADCLEVQKLYEQRLEPVFPTSAPQPEAEAENSGPGKEPHDKKTESNNFQFSTFNFQSEEPPRRCAVHISGKPHVLIPVFPGTNCEYDMERAFIKSGAETEVAVIKNLTPIDIEWSVRTLYNAIGRSQILALPGGFSGGDEPDGAGKFIVSLFRNMRIKVAVNSLLKQRDGLICGICNGFQALIKLGLVPYGEITDTCETSPTLTFNRIGRHQSMLVRTRIVSNKSPWLSNANAGQIHTIAVSHGEGRFTAGQPLIDELAANGQIAAQYVDLEGNPSMDERFNPNGSVCAVEAITSPDGRVLGKMGHNERTGSGLYVNYPEEVGHDIFSAAVNYFK